MSRAEATDRSSADRTPSGRPAPSAQGSVEQSVARAALDLVNDLTGPDGPLAPGSLTFAPDSLGRLDEVLEALREQWLASGGTGVPIAADVRNAFASYVGEVVRKEFGGRYVAGDAQNPFWLAVGSPPVKIGVCARVTSRVADGAEASIANFYENIAPALGRGEGQSLV